MESLGDRKSNAELADSVIDPGWTARSAMICRFLQKFRSHLTIFSEFFAHMRKEFTFKLFVDVTTLGASIATVIALVLLLHDRPEQAKIAAWQLLQNYLQSEKRAEFDQGQSFALETLVSHDVSLSGLDGHGITLFGSNLQGADAGTSVLANSSLINVDLSKSYFDAADLTGATLNNCTCNNASFTFSTLRSVRLFSGDFRGTDFEGADISDLTILRPDLKKSLPKFSADAFVKSCYAKGHDPKLPGVDWRKPMEPHGEFCTQAWGEEWSKVMSETPVIIGGAD
jgi:hypothetical protein